MTKHRFIHSLTALALIASFGLSALPVGVAAKISVKHVTTKKIRNVKRPRIRSYRLSVSAIRGRDEKNFTNPQTRCLIPPIVRLHDQAIKEMNADIQKFGSNHDNAVKQYQEDMDIIWAAMHEPYCGYGAYRTTAVKHSFDKSVTSARDRFLAAVK